MTNTAPAIGTPGVYDVAVLQPFVDQLPPEEQEGGMLLIFNLLQLSKLVDAFAAAVALLDYVETRRSDVEVLHPGPIKPIEIVRTVHLLKCWSEMAGRDAVMTVFNFERTIASIRAGLNNTPTIKAAVDHQRLRTAAKRFRQEFPHAEKARHAVGHSAELTATIPSLSAHAETGVFIFGQLKDRTYTVSFDGVHRELSLDKKNRLHLAEIASEIFSSFPRLESKLPELNIKAS